MRDTTIYNVDEQVEIDGVTYWLNAEVQVDWNVETSDEERPYWGRTVFERITTAEPICFETHEVALWDENDVELDLDTVMEEKAAQKAAQLAEKDANYDG